MGGAEHILGVIGPLSTSIAGIRLFLKTLIDAEPWLVEPSLIPLPWRDLSAVPERKLRVGVMWDDGVVKPHPPVVRALRELVEQLKGVGAFEFVDWEPYKHDLAWDIIVSHPH